METDHEFIMSSKAPQRQKCFPFVMKVSKTRRDQYLHPTASCVSLLVQLTSYLAEGVVKTLSLAVTRGGSWLARRGCYHNQI